MGVKKGCKQHVMNSLGDCCAISQYIHRIIETLSLCCQQPCKARVFSPAVILGCLRGVGLPTPESDSLLPQDLSKIEWNHGKRLQRIQTPVGMVVYSAPPPLFSHTPHIMSFHIPLGNSLLSDSSCTVLHYFGRGPRYTAAHLDCLFINNEQNMLFPRGLQLLTRSKRLF